MHHLILVLCLYSVPKNAKHKRVLLERLDLLLTKWTQQNSKKKLITAGINVDLIETHKPEACSFLHMLKYYGFSFFCVKESTRPASQICLNNIITNIKNISISIRPCAFSDHSFLVANIPPNNRGPKTTFTVR